MRPKWKSQLRRAVGVCAFTGALACAPGSDEQTPNDQPTVNAPRPATALPSALLGTAPALRGSAVHYVPGDSATTGYLAIPEGSGPFPAVILIHEWNGLVDRVREVADALAEEGYVALAADVFKGRVGTTAAENRALVTESRADSSALIRNLDEAQAFLRRRPDVTGRIAAMGWCFGGGVALSYALGGAQHDGTAIFYGSLIEDPDVLGRITHEVYGTFAELDQGIPPDQVERFVAALRSIGVENDVHVYDAVNHGFWLRADQDLGVREAPALDAWNRLRAYLHRTLRN